MRFTKPEWVIHQDTSLRGDQPNNKRLSIFSVHVHPDGSRIATGGLDAKIRIWSTKPILNEASEKSGKPPKALCTLAMHTGPVLTVRWAHSGRWLASGSDDAIVMIWDLDPHGSGRAWGSDDVNVEGWKALKRLPGHESDITDVAWAPGDRYLASVGLDSSVLIWCGYTLERLHKLDLHQGFVKGVCWDPVGEFLATQSDDKTVKIWRTSDWGLEAEIRKPFEDSPGSTFFRRLSWSPDGAHITASNAMNNNGFVFVAAVITRNVWTSEISLVGHENTVEVAAYNPHIFLRNKDMPAVTANICSVVALGADDCSISIWQTKSARPLIVAKDAFERQILDLSWSWDGLSLYAVSSDGTLGVFNFEPEELDGIQPREVQLQYLEKYHFVPPELPFDYSHADAEASKSATTNGHSSSGFHDSHAMQNRPGEVVNKLVAKRGPKNKRRIQPTNVPSAAIPSASTSFGMNVPVQGSSSGGGTTIPIASASSVPTSTTTIGFGDGAPEAGPGMSIKLPPPPLQSISRGGPLSQNGGARSSSFGGGMDMDFDFGGMDMDVPINALDTNANKSRRKGTGSDFAFGDDGFKAPKARTLGGDRVREGSANIDVRELRAKAPAPIVGSSAGFGGGLSSALSIPPLKSFLECRIGDSQDVFEARNDDGPNAHCEVTFFSNKCIEWLDYLPAPALLLTATSKFCAVAMEDGGVNVYSHTGRRLMPTMNLDSPCSFFEASKHYLLAITASGQLYIWNVKSQQACGPPSSVLPLLSSSPNCSIVSASIRPNGTPLMHLSTGCALSFDSNLLTWVRISEPWWSQGSSHWKSRQRTSNYNNGSDTRGIVASVEGRVTERISSPTESNSDDAKPRPSWWTAAMTLGHLETRLHAAKLLESPAEYKQNLLLYAKTIADEGFRGKGEDLLRELYGPVYWRPGRGDESWSPTILGLAKRDLAKDVLNVFARSKSLYKLATDYQELLKKSTSDD